MAPYIIINGKNSKNVTGLLIQSLPPITKPKIRTSIEEIDGRDGDIITTLGYAAYDKQISIGLHGDYNVDDVIEFFNTSGKITFSNEIDKYYLFSTYDTIDFNRLVRFKTANVNFHVQPFKYSIEEPLVKWANEGGETIADFSVRNNGNIYAKPTIKIAGTGVILVKINNVSLLNINLNNETIIIDAQTMNATDESGNYLNRKVTGDYNKLRLKPGINYITVTGQIETVEVSNYMRWV